MEIEKAIKILDPETTAAALYGLSHDEAVALVEDACRLAVAAFRAQQEAGQQIVHCRDCVRWEPKDAMGGMGKLERLGICIWISGVFTESDFCSRGKRRPPAKEG